MLSLAKHGSHFSTFANSTMWLSNFCMFDEYNIVFWHWFKFHSFNYPWFDKYIYLLAIKVYHSVIVLFPFPIFLMFSRLIFSSSLSILDITLLSFWTFANMCSWSSLFNFVYGVFCLQKKFNVDEDESINLSTIKYIIMLYCS